MPTITGPDHKSSRLVLRMSVIISVVVIVIGGVFWWKLASAAAAKDKFNQAMNQAAALNQQGKYADERRLLQTYINSNPPKQYRYAPLMILGGLAYQDHGYQDALSYYKQAEAATGQTRAYDAAAIAETNQAMGQKEEAIKYYKLAIKLTAVDPGVANEIEDYKAAIKHLGGTP